MKELDVNSKAYWNNRFNEDWKEFDGESQTAYFASLLCELLPEWLKKEVIQNEYDICDIGCAEGDSLPILKQTFITNTISGEDFSDVAIDLAKNKYPEFVYRVSDILQPEDKLQYPVIISSNTLEHFKYTYDTLKQICKRSSKYTIILIPYREEQSTSIEHEVIFYTDNIPLIVENNMLVYTKSVHCSSKYYPYEQLLLVYSKDTHSSFLSDVSEHVETNSMRSIMREKMDELSAEQNKVSELLDQAEEHENQLRESNEQILQVKTDLKDTRAELEKTEKKLSDTEDSLLKAKDELIALKNELVDEKDNSSKKDLQISQNNKLLQECEDDYISLYSMINKSVDLSNHLDKDVQWTEEYFLNLRGNLVKQIENLLLEKRNLESEKQFLIDRNQRAINQCIDLSKSRLFKINHLLYRIKYQFLKGDRQERKAFRRWMKSKLFHHFGDCERRYNQIYSVIDILNDQYIRRSSTEDKANLQQSAEVAIVQKEESIMNQFECLLSAQQKSILSQNYNKFDVFIFAVIDYDFRYQRPQHFAARFAENGHRVFYINANHHKPISITNISENLYVVNLNNSQYTAIYSTDWTSQMGEMKDYLNKIIYDYCIRDAITIVDYPNWVHTAKYLRETYGFKIVTDYMDDFTGFLNPAEKLVGKNCKLLLDTSDLVIPSSQFLCDIAEKYNKHCDIVRNGTEFEHFHAAVHMEKKHSRKVIGYYGAVAHWFDCEKVCYVADQFPECDVIIIGDVTEGADKLKSRKNIKLLGEKPYKELPPYLAGFDVCLIPFETSTDLIKATNPVKFYEYLSAGKKVVATDIPELEPYKDEYVYMTNDNELFAEYIRKCLEGTDTLANAEKCIEFAKTNDWQCRYEAFAEQCRQVNKKVSVIVVTYNNLAYNKQCVESILTQTAYPNYELIIVDNQSTDGTVEYLKELQKQELEGVKIILNEKNIGFAGGNNIGIREAVGDYVLLLNNDTIVSRGWLSSMVRTLERDQKLGMCNPTTNSIGNECMVGAKYRNKKEFREFAYQYTHEHLNETGKVEMLPLFCTLIRSSVIDQCGMLDEGYKIGMFEDDDYTMAVTKAGYTIAIAEDCFIHHINGGSFKKLNSELYQQIFETNKSRFESKWNTKWKKQKYRTGVTADINKEVTI